MPAIAGAFQFDHDEPGGAIDAQEIDAAMRGLEVSELLSYHEEVVT